MNALRGRKIEMVTLKEMTIEEVHEELKGKSVSEKMTTALRSAEMVFPNEMLVLIAISTASDGQTIHLSTNGSEEDVQQLILEMGRDILEERRGRARPH